MSSPMYDDLPVHLKIGVTKDRQGPVGDNDPDLDHFECWCGETYPCPVEPIDIQIFERCLDLALHALDRSSDLQDARRQLLILFGAKYGCRRE